MDHSFTPLFGYGFFAGGDPRNFEPSPDECSPEELANHLNACLLWDIAEKSGKTPTPEDCPSGWDATHTIHVLRAPYGIGVYTVPEVCNVCWKDKEDHS